MTTSLAAYDTDTDCGTVGGMLAPDARIYLCGRVTVERNGRVLTDAALGGRQARLLFAFLGTRRTQPASKAQLIEAIWGSGTPPSVETAINALVSKLRAALRELGVPRPHGVASDVSTYQFVVPSAWIDIEDARTAIDRAEGALRGSELSNAWASANVAAAITRQPFLPDEEHAWVHQQRAQLQRVWRRALLVLASGLALWVPARDMGPSAWMWGFWLGMLGIAMLAHWFLRGRDEWDRNRALNEELRRAYIDRLRTAG